MNYIYRPLAMEHMCPYQYYSETKFIKHSDVQKQKIECVDYTEEHPYQDYDCNKSLDYNITFLCGECASFPYY
jgi:hypothetical protein